MMSVNEIKDYLTKYLPSDIGIVEVSEASEEFQMVSKFIKRPTVEVLKSF